MARLATCKCVHYNIFVGVGVLYVNSIFFLPCVCTVDPPEITEDPMDVNATFGENANFTCTASGPGTLMFSWTATATVSPFPSATEVDNGNGSFTSTLELTMVDTGYRGDYTCTVTNAGGTELSEPATLTVTCELNIFTHTVVA